MNRSWVTAISIGLLLTMLGGAAHAQGEAAREETSQEQRRWSDEVWTPIVTHEGVRFSYIFYSEADNTNNGVVVRLDNENDYPVRYRFRMVFRSGQGDEHIEPVEGTLRAHQVKTGDNDGLFWIPFVDGRSVGEVGLRGYHITPLGSSES